MLTPFEFGRAVKRAQQDAQALADAIGAEGGEPAFTPPVPSDPLGVGPSVPNLRAGMGRAQFLSSPKPLPELLQRYRATPGQMQTKPKPKTLDIRPGKPIRTINPNTQTT